MNNLQQCLENIMVQFNFKKVRKVMVFLKWRWLNLDRVPLIYDLKHAARSMLQEAVNSELLNYYTSCGGFYVEKLENEYLRLYFSIDEWEEDIFEGKKVLEELRGSIRSNIDFVEIE